MNPFDGVSPSIDVFGTQISALAVTLLGGVWGLVLVFIAIYAVIGAAKWAAARQSARTEEMTEAAGKLKVALLAFGICVALPIIIGAILFIVGSVG